MGKPSYLQCQYTSGERAIGESSDWIVTEQNDMPYSSMRLTIKKAKKSKFFPECSYIVLRVYRGTGLVTLHTGSDDKNKLTLDNLELERMASEILAKREYFALDLMLDRATELGLIVEPPVWYHQWRKLLAKCEAPVEYVERVRVVRYAGDYPYFGLKTIPDTLFTEPEQR